MAKLNRANKDAEVDVQVTLPDENADVTTDVTTEGDVTPEAEAKSENDTEKTEVQNEGEATVDVTVDSEDSNKDFVAPEIQVDTTPVDNSTQATPKKVRVRMREDHRCWVNNELSELKKGQCYNVPVSVKKRLNKAGVLLPL